MGEELFRQSALDKLASPERLDVLMEVTPAKGWIATATFGAMLAGLVLWSVFGTIPDRVDGQGILVRGGGLRQLRASGDGALTKLAVKLNDAVVPGQIVGEISQVGTSEEIKAAQQQLQLAERDYDASKAEDEATIAGIRATIAGLEADKRSTQLLLERARVNVARLNESLKQGLVTRAQVEQAERDRVGLEATLTSKDAQIANQNAQIRSVQQRIRAKEDAVARARRELERVSVVTSSLARIQSTVEGKIIELRRRVGDFVRNGEVIAIVEPPGRDIQPIVYVSAASGKRLARGMEAQISPTTVRREEYGFMKGVVQEVGQVEVSADAVKSVTANDQLAQEFLAGGGKIEVQIGLLPNPETPSGYTWSSSSGPPFKIETGTRVAVSVVAARTSPFKYYVVPMVRSLIGG